MKYGKEIRVRRAELNIAQDVIAEKCKTTKQNISRYENDKVKEPDYRLLKDIYAFLGLDTNQFDQFTGTSTLVEIIEKNNSEKKTSEIASLEKKIETMQIQIDMLVQLLKK